jgi:PTS system mannose-specific IIA component
MTPVLVLTHGTLAEELVAAARMIDPHLGECSRALSLPWDIDSDEASALLRSTLRDMDQGSGVLVLTDMFGGTATNLALPLLNPDEIEVVTGVNLPMLIKFGSLCGQEIGLHELANRLTTAGQKSIRVASEFLRHPTPS